MKSNTVAVVSDGSAVLGLGNIGALAAMPVMEGKAVLLVANMYLKSAVSCASHEGKIRGAAWVAYDEAARAKAIDPSIAADAQKVMNAAHSQWPSKEDMFFNSINQGSAFSVGCWIGKGTTARCR